MLTRELLAFVRASLPSPPARVLEIGAGRGELAIALGSAGYQVTAIDPGAEPGRHVQRQSLIEVSGVFDAAVAVVALHHVTPLEASCAHLATLMEAGGTLVIDEIDVDRYDERAAGWWLEQRRALGFSADHDPAQMVAGLRDHVHSLSTIQAALRPHFEFGPPIPGAYLHRWELQPGLIEAEIDLIAAGRLPAVGSRQIATRRDENGGQTTVPPLY
jgi:SAM-dependent methyltransferase